MSGEKYQMSSRKITLEVLVLDKYISAQVAMTIQAVINDIIDVRVVKSELVEEDEL